MMRSLIRLSSLFRCQLCHNIFRSESTKTANSPLLNVVTNSTVVGRPFLLGDNVFVEHPVYSAINILINSPGFAKWFDPFSLVEVKVAPLGNWLMKEQSQKNKQVTVREYLADNDDVSDLANLDLDEVYLFDLEKYSYFFNSVIPVGKMQRKISSLRPDNVWYFGGLKENRDKPDSSISFSPDDMLEPEKRVKKLPWEDLSANPETKYFFNVAQKSFAQIKHLPSLKLRTAMREEILSKHKINSPPHPDIGQQVRSLTKQELLKRRDFRTECVFSIDPPTARDLDDALHVRPLEGGRLEVGVHIADVSHYVPSKSRLCKSAMNRGTSFYLGDEVIPMLPSSLSDDLCSLHPGDSKLTVSVVFEMDYVGHVRSYWIGESVISSCAKISYTQANEMIDQKRWPADLKLFGNHTQGHVIKSVRLLQKLSVKLRKRRREAGALAFSVFKTETLPGESEDSPISFTVKLYGKSSILIEEFMLLTNMTVAEFLRTKLPNQALLRRHPQANKVEWMFGLGEKSEKEESSSKTTSAAELQKQHKLLLDKFTPLKGETSKADIYQVVNYFAIRSMFPAEYVVSNSGSTSHFFHFGLQVPLYTHFTSPIRRFADLVVHYQVKAMLQVTTPPDRLFLLRSVAISNRMRSASRKLTREMLQFHVWNALMATGSVFSKIFVVSANRHRLRFFNPTFEVLGALQYADDESILNSVLKGTNHVQLTVVGCSRCLKPLTLDVKPMTQLYCYLTPGEKMQIKAALAHTITCPTCAHGEPKSMGFPFN